MSTEQSKGDTHPERSKESQEWVERCRELRQRSPDFYSALGGDDHEDEIDPDKYGYGKRTSSK
jgi:hypothetical protein